MPRNRLRTITLWTGTTLSVLIAVAFVVSAWWYMAAQANEARVYVVSGAIAVRLDAPWSAPLVFGGHSDGLRSWNFWGIESWWVKIPLYAVFAAVAIPTLLVWRFWPKPVKPGHCRCGYDLTGNTSGVCPECGVEVQT